MKALIWFVITGYIPALSFAQQFFYPEGVKTELGKTEILYGFDFDMNQILTLTDSSITHINPTGDIIQTYTYTRFPKKISEAIYYKRTDGQDSLIKRFKYGELSGISSFQYDSQHRTIYHDFIDLDTAYDYNTSYQNFYEYKDSLAADGIYTTLYAYTKNGNSDKKLLSVRQYPAIQPTYDEEDTVLPVNELICDYQEERHFVKIKYTEVLLAAKELLKKYHESLSYQSPCKNFWVLQESPDKQTWLLLLKRKPYRCQGLRIVYFTTE